MSSNPIRVLSLTQPWASLVDVGAKKIETRSWYTQYRGPLAIHASKGFPLWAREFCVRLAFGRALDDGGIYSTDELPLGAILAVCRLVDCRSIDDTWSPDETERQFGDYSPMRWAWMLADVRRLPEPIPARGKLGLWVPEPDVLARFEEFMKEVSRGNGY